MISATDKQVFISHASEDKREVAKPLADALERRGWSVWLDAHDLTVGDSLMSSINHGLARCKFGVVVLSRHFLGKPWPRRELDGLAARETATGEKMILPVWHGVELEDIVRHIPMLADRLGVLTSRGIAYVAEELSRAMEAQNVLPAGIPHSPLPLFTGIDRLAATWSHDLLSTKPAESPAPVADRFRLYGPTETPSAFPFHDVLDDLRAAAPEEPPRRKSWREIMAEIDPSEPFHPSPPLRDALEHLSIGKPLLSVEQEKEDEDVPPLVWYLRKKRASEIGD